ncbi:hypothetical protein O3M35_012318 [Rhynocoris fuscipes]|uniref:Uncharacterized protein n=1 Tax=Rhynocoris fuscipes TaxID=488301 RepID=A0AAW1CVW3_9HEMI
MFTNSLLLFLIIIISVNINYIHGSNNTTINNINNNISDYDITYRLIDSVKDFVHTVGHIEITQLDQNGISTNTEQGRGNKGLRMAIPLIIGFKIASIITAAIGALKLLVLNSVVFSGLSILASLALFARYIFEKLSKMNQHHSAAVESSPYHSIHQQYAWEPAYSDSHGSHAELLPQYSSQLSSSTVTDSNNGSSYNFIPSGGVNERNSYLHRPAPVLYKTTLYKTIVKRSRK